MSKRCDQPKNPTQRHNKGIHGNNHESPDSYKSIFSDINPAAIYASTDVTDLVIEHFDRSVLCH
ncbi:MAG: hypothetical protein AAFN40_04425 [Cyanobacteria bacterium J06560_6]